MPTIRFTTSDAEVTFPDGEEVNLLRVAIRNDCGVPFKCASGNCGTDRVRVLEGLEHCVPVRRRERERLGELLDQGYRLACQTYVNGDVSVAWDPDQTALPDRVSERLKQVWLAKDDTGMTEPSGTPEWVDVSPLDELAKRKKVVHEHEDRQILVLLHEGEVYAFHNVCIHRQRELHRGVILNGKLVCPGHQWAFALGTGYEAVRDQCQPTYATRVSDGVVQVDLTSCPHPNRSELGVNGA